ncbi:hypothetical protein KQ313_11390 [Synechococcus sp. CS-1325]|nr:hypothetical protein [Synechococcus sp. CS-1325]
MAWIIVLADCLAQEFLIMFSIHFFAHPQSQWRQISWNEDDGLEWLSAEV